MELTAGMPLLNFRSTWKNAAPVYRQAVHTTLLASHKLLRCPPDTAWSHTQEGKRALVVIVGPFQTKSGEQIGEPIMTSYVVTNLRVSVSEKAIYFRSFRDYVVHLVTICGNMEYLVSLTTYLLIWLHWQNCLFTDWHNLILSVYV